MNHAEIKQRILELFEIEFEIVKPGLDDDLREKYSFDSIDAIELLGFIEDLLGIELTQEQKKDALQIRTLNQIFSYVFALQSSNLSRY